ncbi:MAG: nucleotidyltransferase domain-containing protein [Armatimonadota bacterium]
MAVRVLAQAELTKAIRRWMLSVGVEDIILYGLRARDDHLLTSDVDLIVISPRFAATRPHCRLADVHAHLDPELPFLEVLAYAPEEFERARHSPGIGRIAHQTGIRTTAGEYSEADAGEGA